MYTLYDDKVFHVQKKLFLQINNESVFFKMKPKVDEGLDFQNWVIKNPSSKWKNDP